MSAVLTGMSQFKSGAKAVLIRRGSIAKGYLKRLHPPLEDGDTLWMLTLEVDPRAGAIVLRDADTVYTSSKNRCLACTRPGDDTTPPGGGGDGCGVCFDGYL